VLAAFNLHAGARIDKEKKTLDEGHSVTVRLDDSDPSSPSAAAEPPSAAIPAGDNVARLRPRLVFDGRPLNPDKAEEIERRLAECRFAELEIRFDREHRTLFYFMQPRQRPCATLGVMSEIKQMQAVIREIFAERSGRTDYPIRYLVLASRVPGIFNLGGDLELFARLIEERDRRSLEDYAKLSIDVIHANAMALDLPIITVSLVQGDALGGGMEAAMCGNVVIAERGTKFGLPEILFGLFPGMGGYSLLARRIGVVAAERMIFSGKIYSAEELHALGVVDVVAEQGAGIEAVRTYCMQNAHRHRVHQSIFHVRNVVNPLTYREMKEIAMTWVEAALRLEAADIRKMRRLASAQARRSSLGRRESDAEQA
jgi:DSF synthase